MDISMQWLNQYLSPADLTPKEADHILTEAGMPIEEYKPLDDGDMVLDVEVTSNRGDCLGHIGIAREIAAARYTDNRRTLMMPELASMPTGASIEGDLKLNNAVPDVCPLFTARLLRNVKVGPSPDWLVKALESMGQRSINNVVDITNFITLELGNPCHVFDYDKLAGHELQVRYAKDGEEVNTLYAGKHKLKSSDLVVADANGPQSLAGIIGGHDSQVDENTTTVVFEMATWDTVTVRNTGRRLNIRTDAAFRFERGIDPRTIDYAAQRAVQLICEVAGAELAEGVLSQGSPLPEEKIIELRPSRCDVILGVHSDPKEIAELLNGLSIRTEITGETLRCAIPPHRSHDLLREIDLIEEVARARSLAVVPASEKVCVKIREPQQSERAVRAIGSCLSGMGFFETITYSFTNPKKGQMFLRAGQENVAVDDDRRKAEPTLRPSVLLGLMYSRKANQDARATTPGGVRLFEIASCFAQKEGTTDTIERRQLALLMDVEYAGKSAKHDDIQRSVRMMRGTIESVVALSFGGDVPVTLNPSQPVHGGFAADAHATITVEHNGNTIELGSVGVLSDAAKKSEGLTGEYIATELWIEDVIAPFPPISRASLLPAYPGIERDLSLIVAETTPWSSIETLARSQSLAKCVGYEMVSVYRGKQVGEGKKSVTLRLQFRDDDRTLTHEEVDPQMDQLASVAKSELNAEIRS
ncbi:MAG: phenylalanine--tRNA ligase subunit beta [Phycisphaerales bacterium]|nr:phenylalanine--tRNA ligase subunit beta [Phycisphaerales bacterium]